MHGFGAEVFIEEARKCNDMMIYCTLQYRCIDFIISYLVDALIIKMKN